MFLSLPITYMQIRYMQIRYWLYFLAILRMVDIG
jgi:hypothetical protein